MTPMLIIGSSGLIGSRFVELSRKNTINLLTPSHAVFDILNKKLLMETILKYRPNPLINFSAITNIDETEKERGNKKGKAWQTNVIGQANLVAACKASGSFLIQISSDAVFPGTEDYPGPYQEDSSPGMNGKGISWYGYTKLIAEIETKKLGTQSAIVRISYPFGNLHSEKDLIRKTMSDIKDGYSIFVDQQFTPTYIDDLSNALWIIIKKRLSGMFHVACQGPVSRWIFSQYIAQKLKLRNELVPGSIKKFIAQPNHAIRTRVGGLDCNLTQRRLNLSFHAWQNALDEIDYSPIMGIA